MAYYVARSLRGEFGALVEKTVAALKNEGFGVLTDIDIAATLKQKIGADIPAYRILGACNPAFAQKALAAEDKIGVMLPCNVVVRDAGGGAIEVAAIDPRQAMQAIGNPALTEVAEAVASRLANAIDAL
jgi:uncharacterized protein (DUF302 family)